MIVREFNASSIVVLPRANARELLAIARALVGIANQMAGLPSSVIEARDDVSGLIPTLSAAISAPESVARADVRTADRNEDIAVGGLVDFLQAWASLPESEYSPSATAKACLEVLLEGKGLEFLTFKPAVEFSEVQRRMDNLSERKLDAAIRRMGGGAFLDRLETVHKAYGIATGVTAPKSETESPAIGQHSREMADAIRVYVLRVAASVNARRPGTDARAERLLQPLRAWTSAASAAIVEDSDDPANDDATAEARRKVG